MDGNLNNNQYSQPQGQPVPPQGQPVPPQGQPIPPQGQPIPPYNYGAPVYNPQNLEPVSIGTWVGIILLSLIPCVNIILLFVWAFGDGKESRKNWAKAQLIVIAIAIVVYIILLLAFGAAIVGFLSDFPYGF
ncbi:MAG: hypothetical protein J6X36_08070 [Lachnospiraceae bacterium]|nr:hypothetical protein [Lachnospiraceae bacterium]